MKFLKIISAAAIIAMMQSCSKEVVSTQPETVVVTRPAPPYVGAVWVDHEYRWRRGAYVVVPGHYVRHRGVWVTGHWAPVRGGYRWHRGHWR